MAKIGSLSLAALLISGGCGAGQRPTPAPETVAPTPPPAEAPALRWEGYEEALSWPAVQDTWQPSRGHGTGDWSLQIRTDPDTAKKYRTLSPATRFGPGTVLVAVHRTSTGESGPVFAMSRTPEQGWSYVAADASGHHEQGADLTLCARCHAEAPYEQLFGLAATMEPANRRER